MTSSVAMPMQLLLTTCESLFIIDNKLRGLAENFDVPALTRIILLEEILEKTMWQKTPRELFCAGSKVLSIEELWQFCRAFEHESLSFEANSFEKVKHLELIPSSPFAEE